MNAATHVIEGLDDGRIATYTKIHHALVDGVSSMRLLQSVLSKDPDERDMPPPWGRQQVEKAQAQGQHDQSLFDLPVSAFRSAFAITAEAAGMPAALLRTLTRGVRNDTSALSLYAPRTVINKPITGSRRFAAQSWEIERMRSVGAGTSTTINDVVLAMCSGAMRRYLLELGALPDSTLVAMVPVGLKAKEAGTASATGGNAVGSVMVKLGTDVEDPAERLRRIHRSMASGKEALATMTPVQIMAMSAIGMAPAVLPAMLGLQGLTRPPFNLIISNVPGPKEPHYFNGARLAGMWPLSIPIHGMALNITCTSYNGEMGFGLTGCQLLQERAFPSGKPVDRRFDRVEIPSRHRRRERGLVTIIAAENHRHAGKARLFLAPPQQIRFKNFMAVAQDNRPHGKRLSRDRLGGETSAVNAWRNPVDNKTGGRRKAGTIQTFCPFFLDCNFKNHRKKFPELIFVRAQVLTRLRLKKFPKGRWNSNLPQRARSIKKAGPC